MKQHNFRVGDKVKAIRPIDEKKCLVGKKGIICCITSSGIGIEFIEKFLGGHDCGHTCKNGHGRYTYNANTIIKYTDKIQEIKKKLGLC